MNNFVSVIYEFIAMIEMIDENKYSRIIAVGDIHGYIEPVNDLLKKIDPGKDDLIIFLGDYIDRGPFSKQVIDRMLELSFLYRDRVIFLRGNHEDMFLGSVGFDAVIRNVNTWLYNGGTSTLKSYGMSTDRIMQLINLWDDGERFNMIMKYFPESHINFIRSTQLWAESKNYFFCHAGLDPRKTIEEGKKDIETLLWIREHLRYEDFRWEKTVVCGHTPLQEILVKDKLICIDTGLYYFGTLTAMDVLHRRIYQVHMRS